MKKILLILALLALVPARGSATELIVNGGFETGDLTGWDTSGEVIVATTFWDVTPYSGTYMAVLSPYGFLDAGLAQDIDFTGYTSATVTFAYKLGAFDWSIGDWGTDRLLVYLGEHLLLDQAIADAWGGGTTTTPWTPYSYVVPTEWLSGSLRIIFWSENAGVGAGEGDGGQNMVVYVDNISVNATVPDLSSTLLLLAMGLTGLAGAARRRLLE